MKKIRKFLTDLIRPRVIVPVQPGDTQLFEVKPRKMYLLLIGTRTTPLKVRYMNDQLREDFPKSTIKVITTY